MTLEIGIVITLVTYAVATVVGFYAILDKSEKKVNEMIREAKAEAMKMHETQDTRLTKAEEKAQHIETNYNAKFALVYENQHKSDMQRTEQNAALESRLIAKVAEVESNIRDSHHKASKETHNALLAINVTLAKLAKRNRPRRRIV